MSFPRYPKYKDSGVEWLGEVPEHWRVKRLKRACRAFPSNVDKKSHEGEKPVRLCNYTDVYYNEEIVDGMDFMAATASDDQIEKFTLRAGDTIITKDSESADDIAVAAHVPDDLPGVVCGYHLSMIRPLNETDGAFVKRLFDSTYVRSCFEVRANGLTRMGLGQYAVDNVELPFPPPAEQTAIAAFLDRETAKIDGLVAEQRRLMELLKEKRQAVISHAVTKGLPAAEARQAGLNPDAPACAADRPMKPSGIEWLGEVPEHWEIFALKRLAALKSGDSITSESIEELGEYAVFGGNGLRGYTSAFTHEGSYVLIGRQGALCGNINYAEGKFWASEHAVVVTPKHECNTTWLGELLRTMNLNQYSVSAAQPGLSVEIISDLSIPVPPISEQGSIASFIDSEVAKLDTLTTEAQRAIDLLQERRTALISAAVTGQIDVRGVVALAE